MKHGCCVENVCTPETCIALPAGTTCGDCAHMTRCAAIFGHKPGDTACDFYPRRFVAARPVAVRLSDDDARDLTNLLDSYPPADAEVLADDVVRRLLEAVRAARQEVRP